MTLLRFSKSTVAVSALSLVVWSAAPAFAQHHGGGGGGGGSHGGGGGHSSGGGSRSTGGGHAVARSSAGTPRTGAPSGTSVPRSAGVSGVPGVAGPARPNGAYGSRPNSTYGYGYAAPRGTVSTNHYGGAYYNNGHYYGGHYYGGYYGYHYVAPVHYVAPYYAFRPWYSVGFGIYVGYPVAWSYPYYYPAYYPYPYAYPYPSSYPYAGTSYPPYDDQPTNGTTYPSTNYPSQYSAGTTGSVNVQPQATPNQQNSGGISFEITPASAELWVDGVRVGTVGQFSPTSQPLGLSTGRHRIEIKASGYQTISMDADIVAGQVIPYQGAMQR